jgi:hypothetical protein
MINLIYGRRRKLESLAIGQIWKPGNTATAHHDRFPSPPTPLPHPGSRWRA